MAPGTWAAERRAAVAAVRWASVTAPPVVCQTTTTGRVASFSNAFRSRTTSVDSALFGRKAALSLLETVPSLPA